MKKKIWQNKWTCAIDLSAIERAYIYIVFIYLFALKNIQDLAKTCNEVKLILPKY